MDVRAVVVDDVALDNDARPCTIRANADCGRPGGTVIGVAGNGIGIDGRGRPIVNNDAILRGYRGRSGAGDRVSGDRGAGTGVTHRDADLLIANDVVVGDRCCTRLRVVSADSDADPGLHTIEGRITDVLDGVVVNTDRGPS